MNGRAGRIGLVRRGALAAVTSAAAGGMLPAGASATYELVQSWPVSYPAAIALDNRGNVCRHRRQAAAECPPAPPLRLNSDNLI